MSRQQRMAELLETYLAEAQDLLRNGSGRRRIVKQARACLMQWGVEVDRFDQLPVGVLPDAADMEGVLREAGFLAEEVDASKLLDDPRLLGRLVGPIRDRQGQIVSFWARHPQDQPPKYLIKGRWKDQLAVSGLDVALPAMDPADGGLVLIDDLMESVLLHHYGLPPVAAIGGSGFHMNSPRWRRLAELGVPEVTLVLTGPDAHEELRAALGAALAAKPSPRVYVLPPERFEETGGLLPWVRLHGREAFREIVHSERMDAWRYLTGGDDEPPDLAPAEPGIQQPHLAPEEPAPQEVQPEMPRRTDFRRRSSGYCELHHCAATDCFCFD